MEMRLSDEKWKYVSKYLSPPPVRRDARGRARASDKEIVEAILWVLQSGSRWMDLDVRIYPAKSTCHKRFQQWCRDGSWERLQRALVRDLRGVQVIDVDETFIDGSLVKAKKGDRLWPRAAA